MSGKAEAGTFWLEEFNGQVYTPMRMKRKVRSKKREYVGWGSKLLISFLESIGKDTSKQLSQYDVTTIINDYVMGNNLLHPTRKKRVLCDERLHSLFGRKSISRLKIHDMLESHFAENHEESSDDLLCISEDDQDILETSEYQKTTTPEWKTQSKKKAEEKPKSCFAAISPSNVKLVYLKRSLVEDLLKEPETFETKVVGSFIRIRCDPNDYLQKNSHQLLQVTGVKKCSGMKNMSEQILLQVSGFFKDINIHMLSDDNFSEEECEDLHQRVKGGLLQRPLIVDLEQKARLLHEDMTKHSLPRELALLQNLIDRANEKGWRKELDEYLKKREKLQNPDEQARLLQEIPQVIADDVESESSQSTEPGVPDENKENDSPELLQTTYKQPSLLTEVQNAIGDDFEPETTTLDMPDRVKPESNSPKSYLNRASEVSLCDMARSGTALNCDSRDTVSAENWNDIPVQLQPAQQIDLQYKNDGASEPAGLKEAKVCQGTSNKQIFPSQVIELSDDEETEESHPEKQILVEMLESLTWHYRDPEGNVQGPFSLTSLKRWSDANYFSPDFKVWKAGQSQDECALLTDLLHQFFPN